MTLHPPPPTGARPGERGCIPGAGVRGRTCVSPHVRPQVAGLVEALPTLHADEVSLVGLRPERPWGATQVRGAGERGARGKHH